VIEAFDLRNPNPDPGSRVDGMAYPGSYIVDANGVVQEKFFAESHRQRVTSDTVLMSVYGVGKSGGQRLEADVPPQFKLVAFPSEDEISPGNSFVLMAEFEMYDKVHLYGEGSDYTAVNLVLDDNPMLQAHDLRLPEPEIMYLEVIDESVPVYHGKVNIVREVTLSPAFEGDSIEVSAMLEYQTCDDEYCFQPASMPITFNLKVFGMDRERAPEDVRHQEGG
ncbi:MAG: hypothetical protein HOJ88_11430, partial [Proteobacteria bacterium]|nr:hypothetical protein [Pseudomonadota bacterium]